MKLLLIDNYDSFTWNLAALFAREAVEVTVVRNDARGAGELLSAGPDAICLSPGPGTPDDSGVCRELTRLAAGRVPVLGVCLGMQAINEAFGGTTHRAPIPVHGKTSVVQHARSRLFVDVPTSFRVARYHSLCLGIVAPELRVTARSGDGVVMAVEHASWPVYGVQFHPESFLSEQGAAIARNFIRLAGGTDSSISAGRSA